MINNKSSLFCIIFRNCLYKLEREKDKLLISYSTQMEASQELSIVEVSAKLQSNKELYTILTKTGNLYLPPISYANQSYLRGVCNGQKLWIRCSKVKVVKVPHAKGLEVASILKFAFDHFDLIKYLPEYEYQKEPSRELVWNLVNTLIHYQFQEYMNGKISEREAELS